MLEIWFSIPFPFRFQVLEAQSMISGIPRTRLRAVLFFLYFHILQVLGATISFSS